MITIIRKIKNLFKTGVQLISMKQYVGLLYTVLKVHRKKIVCHNNIMKLQHGKNRIVTCENLDS